MCHPTTPNCAQRHIHQDAVRVARRQRQHAATLLFLAQRGTTRHESPPPVAAARAASNSHRRVARAAGRAASCYRTYPRATSGSRTGCSVVLLVAKDYGLAYFAFRHHVDHVDTYDAPNDDQLFRITSHQQARANHKAGPESQWH